MKVRLLAMSIPFPLKLCREPCSAINGVCFFSFEMPQSPTCNDQWLICLFIEGYVPFGTPIVVGLLMPDPTLKQIIFWQWLNQR